MTSRVASCGLLLAVLACSGEDPAGGEAAGAAPVVAEDRVEMPAFRLPLLRGGEVDSASLAGRFVVIDFWATWCLPCEETVPELDAFHRAHRDEGVEVLGISIDEAGPDVVGEWIEARGARYPIPLGDVGLAQRFAAPGFPATYFVAPDGTMGEPHVGYLDRDDLEASLAELRRYADAVAGR